jgi:hypothetical protein
LRLGRRGRNPAYGELELFRNLQRWGELPLPEGTDVVEASITLSLESGPPFPLDIAVYAVKKDWNPGYGGIHEDNNSPPKPGEVWWLDARYGELPWSSAGAGHASDTDPDADTGAQPLAIARYEPQHDQQLRFESAALADYIEKRISSGAPILLLVKLLDIYEDSPGSVMEIWSATYGVDVSTRRPTLRLSWRPTQPTQVLSYPIYLEPGRSMTLPAIEASGQRLLVASFTPSTAAESRSYNRDCPLPPHIEFRAENGTDGFQALAVPTQVAAGPVTIRVAAVQTPVELGSQYVAAIRDTWVTTGKAEEQTVTWTFDDPYGETYRLQGQYIGDYTWQVSLPTNSIGRWTYRWSHHLAEKELQSENHSFDVVAREPASVLAGLRILREEIAASGAEPRTYEMLPFELSFMRMQRAAVALLPDLAANPETVDSITAGLKALREQLSGEPVPDTFEPKSITSREGGRAAGSDEQQAQ